MTHTLRFSGIRFLIALLLGLCLVLGAHAQPFDIRPVVCVDVTTDLAEDAWPVRFTPKPAPPPAS